MSKISEQADAPKKRARKGDGCLWPRTRADGTKGNYEIRVGIGSRKYESIPLKTKNQAEAEKEYEDWKKERKEGDNSAIDGNMPAYDYAWKWLDERRKEIGKPGGITKETWRRDRNRLKALKSFLEEKRLTRIKLAELTPEFFKMFRDWRIQQTRGNREGGVPISQEGANQDLEKLLEIFRGAWKKGLIRKDPGLDVKRLPEEEKDDFAPHTPEELREVFLLVEDPAAIDYCQCVAASGTRAMEMMQLKVKDVLDWDHGIIYIRPDEASGAKVKTKYSKRKFRALEEVMTILRRIRDERGNMGPEDYFFLRSSDRLPFVESPRYAYDQLVAAWEKANNIRGKAGIEEIANKITIRSLRHFFASWAINRTDAPMQEIQLKKYIGHKSKKNDTLGKHYYHPDLYGEGIQRFAQVPLFGCLLSLEATHRRRSGADHPADVIGAGAAAEESATSAHGDLADGGEPSVSPAEDTTPTDPQSNAGGAAFVDMGFGI